jgi:uncharacterized membrane-anchored protein YhcB (DUF1043 family)
MLGILVSLVVGFVAGALVGRNNRNKVEKVVSSVEKTIDKVKR